MSSEGDSSKSLLSEANEKSGTDNNTDDSQDSQDVSDVKAEKPVTENNIDDKKKDAKSDEEPAEADAKLNDIKKDDENDDEPDTKPEVESKVNNEATNETKSEEEVESEDTEKSEKEEPEKNDKTEKKKKEKKEKVEKSEESEKDEESEDDKSEKSEKEVPLLDQPLELSGKRERKNVQRFKEDMPAKSEAKIEFVEGKGTALGDIPRIDASISRFKNDDLKPLHRLLFKVNGKTTLVKKNIRKFNGFGFDEESDEYQKKIASAQKLDAKQLRSICEMLDLQKSGSKDDLVNRIVEFLLAPKDSGKPVDGGRPKRSAAVKANNRGYSSHDDYSSDDKHASRARRGKGKRTNLKDDSSSDEEFQPDVSDNSDGKPRVSKRKRRGKKKSSEEDEISEASIGSSDESDDEPKQKRRKSTSKSNAKSKAKRTPGRRGRPSAASKKTPVKGRGRKKVSESEEEESDKRDDDGSSSEDEPLAKKAKSKEPPTDEEIKTFIKGILEGANLEEITMKTVCQRVYGHYPDFDLTHKKEFIKCTVKSIIST